MNAKLCKYLRDRAGVKGEHKHAVVYRKVEVRVPYGHKGNPVGYALKGIIVTSPTCPRGIYRRLKKEYRRAA